ncbi:hypothetical protein MTsPCn5_20990 [Croceitalea sp. MTPC5]|uniref:OmpA family protein n=1 Tax=Croceitalea sp. MTPC5 TaxID=3056565 RepID=UPI002B3E82C1|nr:hypothetical protein MTsPCn5_20990 [Croceitalea sp. MTPC5]
MTKNFPYVLGMLITIALGMFLYFTLCSDCQVPIAEVQPLKEETVPIPEPQATSFPFTLNDGDFTYGVNDNFNFNLSSNTVLLPLSENVKNGVLRLKDYLSANTDKAINMTGLYQSSEDNTSAFPNLGLARANAVKNYMVAQGISSTQTNTFGQLMNDLVPLDNTLLGPVTYEITEGNKDNKADLKALYDDIKTNPLVLYFDTGEAAINLTEAQRQKVANISRYLDKVDGARCKIVGHTDNTGNRITNITLGQERADFAMAYLIRNGIPAEKINSTSKGPDVPIASNNTEEGRSKNRRTVVTLN